MTAAFTDFGLTEDQRLIRDSVIPMLRRVLPREKIRALDQASEYPLEAYSALAKAGWIGLPYEKRYEGADGSFKDLAVLVESIAYHSEQLASAYMATVIYGGMHINFGASEDLKAEIIPAMIRGDVRLALCLTEPATGSDVAAIRTKAIPDGNDYIISGQKCYITCAHVAHHLVVATKTDHDAGHRGISLFLVDARSPGLVIRPLKGLGRRMIHTNEVFFDDVRVPASRLLGGKNKGWSSLMRGLNIERLCLAAAASGNMKRIIDYAQEFATQRVQFGHPISSYQAIAHKFADMQIMYETSRALTYRVADMMDANHAPKMETAVAKVAATEYNSRCADIGLQIMGGAGYMMDNDMQMFFRDARASTIGGGTSEIMRTVIAKQMGL